MTSLKARAPSSPPVFAIAVTASICPARTLSSSEGIARASLSSPRANAALAWKNCAESFNAGIRISPAAASPMRPAASAPWRRTAGLAWLSASRSGAASNRRASDAASGRARTPGVFASAGTGAAAGGGGAATAARIRKATLETNRVCRGFEQLTHVLRNARKSLLWVQRDQRRFRGREQLIRAGPLDRVSEYYPARGQIPNPAAYANHVIISRRLTVADVNVGDGEVGPVVFQLLVGHPPLAEMFRTGHVHPDQIVRGIDEPHLVGFREVHAVQDRADARSRGLGVGDWGTTRRRGSRCFLLPRRDAGPRAPRPAAHRASRGLWRSPRFASCSPPTPARRPAPPERSRSTRRRPHRHARPAPSRAHPWRR